MNEICIIMSDSEQIPERDVHVSLSVRPVENSNIIGKKYLVFSIHTLHCRYQIAQILVISPF